VCRHLVVPKSVPVVVKETVAQYDYHYRYRFCEEKLYIYTSDGWKVAQIR